MPIRDIIGQAPCPKCKRLSDPSEWRVPTGIDPDMREFRCPYKDGFFYRLVAGSDEKIREREDLKARSA